MSDHFLLNQESARDLLQRVFASLLDPLRGVEDLAEFFSADYVQHVDGVRLDYAGFIEHAQVLKNTLSGGFIVIEQLLCVGNTIADVHIVHARKRDGRCLQVKVLAFFTVQNGKIIAVDELTHMLEGGAEDKDLGSRT